MFLPQVDIGVMGERVMSCIEGKFEHMLWEGLAHVNAASGVAILII